jgi:hypothetical protein
MWSEEEKDAAWRDGEGKVRISAMREAGRLVAAAHLTIKGLTLAKRQQLTGSRLLAEMKKHKEGQSVLAEVSSSDVLRVLAPIAKTVRLLVQPQSSKEKKQ